MAYTLKDLEVNPRLGMSYWELQKRLSMLSEDARFQGVSAKWVNKSGRHGAWKVTNAGYEILVRLHDIEQEGVSFNAALQQIYEEVVEPQERGPGAAVGAPGEAGAGSRSSTAEEAKQLRSALEATQVERDQLRDQRNDLLAERDRLLAILESMTLALPKPSNSRKRGLARLFRRSGD